MTLAEFKAWFDEKFNQIQGACKYNPNQLLTMQVMGIEIANIKEKLDAVVEPVHLPARLHGSTVYECTECGCRVDIKDPWCGCGVPNEVIRKDLLGNSKILKLRKYHYYEVD